MCHSRSDEAAGVGVVELDLRRIDGHQGSAGVRTMTADQHAVELVLIDLWVD
jgi:hypothetical protein